MNALFPACAICQRPCIPLADYDRPVCIHCDDDMAAVMTRAMLAPSGEGRRPRLALCGTHAAFVRHWKNGEPIDGDCRLAERAYQRDRKREQRARVRTAARGIRGAA